MEYDNEGNEIIDAEVISEVDEVLEEVSDQWKLVAYHLQNNHYPPVPLNMVDTCLRAIEYANKGDYDTLIMLPEGTTYKGSTHASVEVIVESHHLHYFIKDKDRQIITVTDPDGVTIYQGYGEEIKLEPKELNEEVDKDERADDIEEQRP